MPVSIAQKPRANVLGDWIYVDRKGGESRIKLSANGQFSAVKLVGRKIGYLKKGKYRVNGNQLLISYAARQSDLPFIDNSYYSGIIVDYYSLRGDYFNYLESRLYFKSRDSKQRGVITKVVDKTVKFIKKKNARNNFLKSI